MKFAKLWENIKEAPVLRYMVYLLIVTSIITGVTFSRYATSFSVRDTARVAQFVYDVAITDPHTTETVTVDPAIYATVKLADAENCLFDEVATVREITVTNESEVAVDTNLTIRDIDDSGIVWFIYNGSYADMMSNDDNMYAMLKSALTSTDTTDFNALRNALQAINQQAIEEWNDDGELGFSTTNKAKTLTMVFWAEHDQAMVKGWDDHDLVSDVDLTVTVSQID